MNTLIAVAIAGLYLIMKIYNSSIEVQRLLEENLKRAELAREENIERIEELQNFTISGKDEWGVYSSADVHFSTMLYTHTVIQDGERHTDDFFLYRKDGPKWFSYIEESSIQRQLARFPGDDNRRIVLARRGWKLIHPASELGSQIEVAYQKYLISHVRQQNTV